MYGLYRRWWFFFDSFFAGGCMEYQTNAEHLDCAFNYSKVRPEHNLGLQDDISD